MLVVQSLRSIWTFLLLNQSKFLDREVLATACTHAKSILGGLLFPRCHRKIQINIADKSLKPYTESEKPSAVIAFEVRGGSPTEFQPAVGFVIQSHQQDGFTVISTGGAKFENVDLQDDFADYDGLSFVEYSHVEDAGEAVSVMNMEWTFESAYSCLLNKQVIAQISPPYTDQLNSDQSAPCHRNYILVDCKLFLQQFPQ